MTKQVSRRSMLKAAVSGVTMASMASMSGPEQKSPIPRKGQIKQSVSRWCYQKIPLDELCIYAAQIGLKGVDLLKPDEYEIPARHGLICSMGYAEGGEIGSAMNRVENHAKIEEGFRKYIPLAAKAGVPNVITFSGNRAGMSDEEGAKNTIAGLNRVKNLPGTAQQQGRPQRLHVRSHSLGSERDASGKLATRQTAV
jgi:hydroxypyruvate isomerase